MACVYHKCLLLTYVTMCLALLFEGAKISNLKHPSDIMLNPLVVADLTYRISPKCILVGGSVSYRDIQAIPTCHHKDIVKLLP